MPHRTQHPWGTGEQLAGADLDTVFDRMEEKKERWDPVIDPGSFAAPESTLDRQIREPGPVGQVAGLPGGHAGYGR
jgi:hypothetical protein